MMHLIVLAVPGCPHAPVLEDRLAAVLGGRAGVSLSHEVIFDEGEAARWGMHGSPTLLIDGADPFAEPGQQPGMSCRLYRDDDGQPSGAPSAAQLQQVIEQALATAAAPTDRTWLDALGLGGACGAGLDGSVRWRIRRFEAAVDRPWVARLWQAAMPSSWPLLPAGIALVGEGLVAEAGSDPVGFVAVDMAGGIPLILVDPAYQRRGIGASLLEAALDRVRAGGATIVTAASGGRSYIWPGVPQDLPGTVRFFTSCGWRHSHDTLDLVADLGRYRPRSGAEERAAGVGVTVVRAASADLPGVLAFEEATFPSWTRWFSAGRSVLMARDRGGNIAGTLLLDGPGAETVFAPMLGPAAGTIGCVGVAPPMQGQGIGTALVARASQILRQAGARNCHIGWTTRESFYRRAGYTPWRRYAMFGSPA